MKERIKRLVSSALSAVMTLSCLILPPGLGAAAAGPDIDSDLMLRYTFESADTIGADVSGNSRDAVPSGNFTTAEGKVGNAAVFDGSSYMSLPGDLTAGAESMTISAWASWENLGSWMTLSCFGKEGTGSLFNFGYSFSNEPITYITTKGVNVPEQTMIGAGINVVANEWHHLAAVVDGTAGKLLLYVDGVKKAESALNDPASLPKDLETGTAYLGKAFFPDPNFKGKMDDYRVYSRALTGEEIMALTQVTENPIVEEGPYLADGVMGDLETIYQLQNGRQSYGPSSYDIDGGNDDGFALQLGGGGDKIKDERVLLDVTGPGVLTRMFIGGYAEDVEKTKIKIYIDGVLTVDTTHLELFSGTLKPFVKPWALIGKDSGGGSYINLPIPFAKSIKITGTYLSYYDFNYTSLPKDMVVESFQMTDKPVIPKWFTGTPGNPVITIDGEQFETKTVSVSPETETTLYEADGPGKVTGLRMKFPGIRDAVYPLVVSGFTARGILADGGSMTFTMQTDPDNTGVWLKHRTDAIWEHQVLDVYVDGVKTGTLDTGDGSQTRRVKDIFYHIDGKYTSGKSKLEIELRGVSVNGIDIPVCDVWSYAETPDGVIYTDYIDIGNEENEAAHHFSIVKQNYCGSNNLDLSDQNFSTDLLQYKTPVTEQPAKFEDDCRAFTGSVTFKMALDPNNAGALLKKRYDSNVDNQKVKVFVDGAEVGDWLTTGGNATYRIKNASYAIPASFTEGKSEVTIKLQFVSSNIDINLYYLWMYSKIDGKYIRSDALDIGPNHTESESTHDFTIEGEAFQGNFTDLTYETIAVLPDAWQKLLDDYYANYVDVDDYVQNTGIRVYYDNETTPSIDTDLGMFLGMGMYGLKEVRALTQGISQDGTFYFYMPMPYKEHIKVVLYRNDGKAAIESIETTVSSAQLPADTDFSQIGYLKTQLHTYNEPVQGQPLDILHATGSGHLVGVIQSMSSNSLGCLEGDEMVYVDGSLSHLIHGTGTEDFYGGAWYYVDGPFTQKFHGCTVIDNINGLARSSAYRFLVNEPISFRNGIDMTIEHGPKNNTNELNARILAFYYHNPVSQLSGLNVVPLSQVELVDGTAPESTGQYRLEANYERTPAFSVTERLLEGRSRITLTVPAENNGVLLRRAFTMKQMNQAAKVYVDGTLAGTWDCAFNRGRNDTLRYDDFILPASLTKGKETLTVEFETVEGYVFGETGYLAWAFAPTAEPVPTDGWVTSLGKSYYLRNGMAITASFANIDGKRYYFGKDGIMLTGWFTLDDTKYYFGEDGVMLTGLQTIDGKKYFFGKDGKLQFGFVELDGKTYYLDENGVFHIGWLTLDNAKYYFGEDGVMLTGLQTIDGKKYFFDQEGRMQIGLIKIDDAFYYFNENGNLVTGFVTEGDKVFCFDKNGKQITGWTEKDGSKLYLDPDGTVHNGLTVIDGKAYLLENSSPVVSTERTIDGKTYRTDADGIILLGLQTINGQTYYYGTAGAKQTGFIKINGKTYYFAADKNGARTNGWVQLGGHRYYFNPTDNALCTGWYQVGAKWYFADGSGKMITGWKKLGKWYYFGADGALRTGWYQVGSKWYFADSSGKMVTGWKKLGRWYYFGTDGAMIANTSRRINGKNYRFDGAGKCLNP